MTIYKSSEITVHELNKLREENKITDEFEVMLSSLTLEEAIGLKFELATKTSKGKYFGFPIWQNMVDIVRETVLKYTMMIMVCQEMNSTVK